MNELLNITGNGPLTMSSREIAELVEKRHDNVKRTIETLAETGVIARPQIEDVQEVGGNNRAYTTQQYLVGKRDSFVIVAQLSPEFTARLVDRWQELEGAIRRVASQSAGAAMLRETRLQHKMLMGILRDCGIKGNQAAISASQATKRLTGVDLMGVLGITHIDAAVNEPDLNVTSIGQKLGLSAQRVNAHLVALGYQLAGRDSKRHVYYELTEKGVAAGGVFKDAGKRHGSGTPIKQLFWPVGLAGRLRAEIAGVADNDLLIEGTK